MFSNASLHPLSPSFISFLMGRTLRHGLVFPLCAICWEPLCHGCRWCYINKCIHAYTEQPASDNRCPSSSKLSTGWSIDQSHVSTDRLHLLITGWTDTGISLYSSCHEQFFYKQSSPIPTCGLPKECHGLPMGLLGSPPAVVSASSPMYCCLAQEGG